MLRLHQRPMSNPSLYFKEQKQLLKLVPILLVSLVAYWTPEFIFYFMWHFRSIRFNVSMYRKHLYIHLICQVIATFKSVVNPYIFAHIVPEIKATFKSVLSFSWIKKPTSIPQDRSIGDTISLTTAVSRSSII